MKNRLGKRIIAVLLCLAVFAGSELTGLTNIVGDLFAAESEEFDAPQADVQTAEIEVQPEEPADEPEEPEAPAPEAPEPEASSEESVPEVLAPETSDAPEEPAVSEADPAPEVPDTVPEPDDPADIPEDTDGEDTQDPSDPEETADPVMPETPSDLEVPEDSAETEDEQPEDIEAVLPEVPAEDLDEEEAEKWPEYIRDGLSDDGKVTVHVAAEEGVFPENTELVVKAILPQDIEALEADSEVSEEEVQEAKAVQEKFDAVQKELEETMAEDETKEIAGFLAYDISFWTETEDEETGESKRVEIEPKEGMGVSVEMEFAAAALPEEIKEIAEKDGVSVEIDHVDVIHMKENEDTKTGLKAEVLTDAEIGQTENVEVETAKFTVESFSTFVITWTGIQQYSLSIIPSTAILREIAVEGSDKNGEIKRTLGRDERISISEIKPGGKLEEYYRLEGMQGEQFVFVQARRCDLGVQPGANLLETGDEVSEIWAGKPAETGGWFSYRTKNGTEGIGGTFYFIYEIENLEPLTEAATIDNEKNKIEIYMKDYAYDANGLHDILGGNIDDGNIKQGLVSKELGADGYPVTAKGDSLAPWFAESDEVSGEVEKVNHLFREDKFKEQHTFYYSSFDNYAYKKSDGNFTVYNQLGAQSTETDRTSYKRGNFFPYDEIEEGIYSMYTNEYGEDGKPLPDGDSRKGERLYAVQNPNFHFSMCLETEFVQAEGGMYDGRPMRYEFNGDDDLWIFIDGVLVLDIGGVHDARRGYIDFSTGEVMVEISENYTRTTNLKECFQGIKDNVEWRPESNTFADYTRHSLKMFYMERNIGTGSGCSSLKMSFNLPTVGEDEIKVTKRLSNTEQEKYADVDFQFQVFAKKEAEGSTPELPKYVEGENEDAYEPLTDANLEGVEGEAGKIPFDENGIFTLKPGQTAVFPGIKEDRPYYVKEIGIDTEKYDKVLVNQTEVADFGKDGTEGDSNNSARSTTKTPKERSLVVFTNECTEANSNELQITKRMRANADEMKGPFAFLVQLKDQSGSWVPYEGKYYLYQESEGTKTYYTYEGNAHTTEALKALTEKGICEETSDGMLYIPSGCTAVLEGLVEGTEFCAEEILTEEEKEIYQTPQMEIVPGTCTQSTGLPNGAGGVILFKKDAQMLVTNALLGDNLGGLDITKKLEGSPTENNPEEKKNFRFLVRIYNSDEKQWTLYEGTYLLGDETKTSAKGVIEIPADGTAHIPDLLPGTQFEITEDLSGETEYQLKSMEADRSTCDPLEKKESGADAPNIVTGVIRESTDAKVTVTNVYEQKTYSYDWQIIKQGTVEGSPNLEGAEFTLTLQPQKGEPSQVYYGKSMKDTGVIAWYASKEEAENEKNPISAGAIAPGTYTLTETKAPLGYMLSSSSWKITLAYGKMEVEDVESKDNKQNEVTGKIMYTYVFTNEAAYELPSTGGSGIFWYTISGTLLMIMGMLVLYKRKFARRC